MLRADDVASYLGEYAVFSSNNVLLPRSAYIQTIFFSYKELAMQFANPMLYNSETSDLKCQNSEVKTDPHFP